jgi:ABC-type sugar transport system substrate-binding protein
MSVGRREIALFLRSRDNDYQARLADDAVKMGERVGFTVRVAAAGNDSARQSAQVAEALEGAGHDQLAAVLVSPVREDALADVARAAVAKGIGWVVLNREGSYVAALRAQFPGVPIFGVTPDQTQIGRIQAEQVKLLLPQGGSLLCITGPANTSSSQRRLEALKGELGPEHKLTVVEADWTSEGARLLLDGWLGSADAPTLPDAVCAQNDEMALGARQALRDAASRRDLPWLGELPIIGCDGSAALGQRMVLRRRLWATVAVPSAAGPAVEWLARVRDGEQGPPAHLTLEVASFPELEQLQPAA